MAETQEAPEGAAASARRAQRMPPTRLQLRTLFKRSWKQVTRDKAAIRLRVASNVQSALVFGTIWWRLRRIQKAVGSRLGMLQARALPSAEVCAEGALGPACPRPRYLAALCLTMPG